MAFLDQNPPSFDNQLDYDKWVAEQLKAADADQERQDEEFKKDQERQDGAIQNLEGLTSTSCDTPPVTGTLQRSTAEPLYWYEAGTADGSKWYLTVTQALHQGEWPWPKLEDTPNIWVNDTKYDVLSVSNTGGIDWKYELAVGSLDHLVGQEVTVSLCSSAPPWVTHEEFEVDQQRQDDALAEEIAARAERDALHDAQINTIEFKLDQLVGLTFKGTYEFKHESDCDAAYEQCIADCWDNDPDDHECRTECGREMSACETDKVRAGYFEAVDPDDQFDHLEQIIISKSDIDGVELDWSGYLDPGDYLEVDHSLKGELDKRNYGLYRITEEPEHTQNSVGEDVYIIKLQFLQGDGALSEGEMFEIRGITVAEGVNPEELADFLTKDEAANLYALKTHSHAWSEITGKPSSFNPSSHTHSQYLDKNTTSAQTIKGNLTGEFFYGSSSSSDNGFMTRKKILEEIANNSGSSVSDTDFVKNGNNTAITISKSGGVYYISGG